MISRLIQEYPGAETDERLRAHLRVRSLIIQDILIIQNCRLPETIAQISRIPTKNKKVLLIEQLPDDFLNDVRELSYERSLRFLI